MMRWVGAAAPLLVWGVGCGDGSAGPTDGQADELPYASEVIEFAPGDGAGFGQSKLPDVVLGPPQGSGTGSASLDVLSLGADGSIVLGFGGRELVDRPGPDLIVFENPFWPGGDPTAVYAELGEVSVSADGEQWQTFTCDAVGNGDGAFPGCAGWTPTLSYDPEQVVPLDPELTGGDAFDLGDLGLPRASRVRIRDLGGEGSEPSAGFDLDAVGLIHFE